MRTLNYLGNIYSQLLKWLKTMFHEVLILTNLAYLKDNTLSSLVKKGMGLAGGKEDSTTRLVVYKETCNSVFIFIFHSFISYRKAIFQKHMLKKIIFSKVNNCRMCVCQKETIHNHCHVFIVKLIVCVVKCLCYSLFQLLPSTWG